MTINDFIQNGLLAFIIIFLIATRFFPSYIKKKGENLATKEDIEQITQKIEQVKSRFDINKKIKKSFILEQKECCLNFYDSITEFRYEFLAANFGDFPQDKGASLFEYQKNFRIKVTEILKRYQRLVLYIDNNSELIKTANDIVNQSLQADKVIKEKFHRVKASFINESNAYEASANGEKKQQYEMAVRETNIANKDYWDSMKPIIQIYIDLYKKYLTLLSFQLNQKNSSEKA